MTPYNIDGMIGDRNSLHITLEHRHLMSQMRFRSKLLRAFNVLLYRIDREDLYTEASGQLDGLDAPAAAEVKDGP